MKQIERVPFLRLLLPFLVGVLLQYYFHIDKWSIITLLAGLAIMLLSYFIPKAKRFNLRWIFGVGLLFFFFAVGCISTSFRQQLSNYNFERANKSYEGLIQDIPQEKDNTFAYRLRLEGLNKEIICYIPKDKASKALAVGDYILFFSEIKPFEGVATDNGFNYATYAYNKGLSGFTFVNKDRWERVDKTSNSLLVKATQYRQKILLAYGKLGLSKDEYSILSALTLGYKDTLSDELNQSFRVTGTAHLLAISGMHVGIIYLMLSAILGLFGFSQKQLWLQVTVVTLLLWVYIFVIGFPPSAVRAAIMLTFYCLSQVARQRAYSLNTLLATAFFMLLWNPFWFFDIGFQLSFVAVLSMLLLLPHLLKWKKIDNRYLRYAWNILLVSLVAQIGTFPLSLYYFGSFPTYFFLSNILIIPLVTVIMYNSLIILGCSLLISILPGVLISFILAVYKYLVLILTNLIHFFENLPFSQISNLNLTFIQLVFISGFIILFLSFVYTKKAKSLIVAQICLLAILLVTIWDTTKIRNSINILNKPQEICLFYSVGYKQSRIMSVESNNILYLNGVSYLIVLEDIWKGKRSSKKFDVDYLHITGNNTVSLFSISQKLNPKKIILDSSLSNLNRRRLTAECEKLRIPYYDVSKNGSLRIFF